MTTTIPTSYANPLVLLLHRLILVPGAMYKRCGTIVVRFCRNTVFVLEVQAHNAHVELKLLLINGTRVIKVHVF